MSNKSLTGRIALLKKTTAQWNDVKTTVLNNGEVGIETTSSAGEKVKIGNGITPWENLPYSDTTEYATDAEVEEIFGGGGGGIETVKHKITIASYISEDVYYFVPQTNESGQFVKETPKEISIPRNGVILFSKSNFNDYPYFIRLYSPYIGGSRGLEFYDSVTNSGNKIICEASTPGFGSSYYLYGIQALSDAEYTISTGGSF